VRNLISLEGTKNGEFVAFTRLKIAWELSRFKRMDGAKGWKLAQHQYDALALAVWAQTAAWTRGVINGEIGVQAALRDVMDFTREANDPENPLTKELAMSLPPADSAASATPSPSNR